MFCTNFGDQQNLWNFQLHFHLVSSLQDISVQRRYLIFTSAENVGSHSTFLTSAANIYPWWRQFFFFLFTIPIVCDGVCSEANSHFEDGTRSIKSTYHLRRPFLCRQQIPSCDGSSLCRKPNFCECNLFSKHPYCFEWETPAWCSQ